MDHVNFQHLLYFWVVAREGGLVAAGRVLRLSHPTISAQIHALEEELGEKLFVRQGRRLVLTEAGLVVSRYAEEIFSLGREMVGTLRGGVGGLFGSLRVGIADVVPKHVVRRLLQPVLALPEPVRLVCREGTFDRLVSELALHTLDLVITDAPLPTGSAVRAYSHLLCETGVTFFGAPSLAAAARPGFPGSLDGAPVLLPLEGLTLRRSINQWLSRQKLAPRVVAEFEDSALLKALAADGLGIFAAPTLVEDEVVRQYGVEIVGRAPEIKERFYGLSADRRLTNPAVAAICDAARLDLAERPG